MLQLERLVLELLVPHGGALLVGPGAGGAGGAPSSSWSAAGSAAPPDLLRSRTAGSGLQAGSSVRRLQRCEQRLYYDTAALALRLQSLPA